MSKRITIEMPEELYEELGEHAAEAEMSLTDYVLAVLDQYIEDVRDLEAAEEELEIIEKMDADFAEEEPKHPSGRKN